MNPIRNLRYIAFKRLKKRLYCRWFTVNFEKFTVNFEHLFCRTLVNGTPCNTVSSEKINIKFLLMFWQLQSISLLTS